MAAGRVGIQVAADEPELGYASFEFGGTVLRRHAGRLRQLAHAHEVVRIEQADAMNEVIARPGPALTRDFVADVVRHGRGARRENRDIRTACALQLQLRIFQAVANLIVGDFFLGAERYIETRLQARDLCIAKFLQLAGSRRVMAVAVDDHLPSFAKWTKRETDKDPVARSRSSVVT